ncbi:DUF6114 domain-containing protein [Micromonospora sp. NPDC049679]|uniref:DUF6114 domain-containing protein n=1 Tax=Micromonospora sp. NPDC049679 TaxID=3155920 RepID=UPI0033FFEED9
MTTANPQHVRSGALARGWHDFRHWRRARPFWGGLLTLIAGLEIFGSTQMKLDGLSFQMGPTGFLSWLIPTILVACGLLMWFTPQQRMFYAIVGSMTAVFSLIAVNLGGFFIGLLLGMVGGALGFAWVPSRSPAPVDEADRTEAVAGDPAASPDETPARSSDDQLDGDDSTAPVTDALPKPRNPMSQPEPVEPPAGQGPSRSQRDTGLLAITLVLLSVSAIGLVTTRAASPAQAAPCLPSVTPSAPAGKPSPGPSGSPTPKPGADDDGNLLTDIIDGIVGLFGGGNNKKPEAAPTPTAVAPTLGPDGKPLPTPPVGRPGACPTKPEPADPAPPAGVKRLAPAPGQPLVAKKPSLLTGSKVTMRNLKIDGIVKLPTAGGGTTEVLQFSMSEAVTDDFLLQVPGPAGKTMRFQTPALTVRGDVKFYASRFVGWIGPLKLTLTPSSPVPPNGIPLTLPKISFDKPEMQLVFVNSDILTGRPSLNVSLG